MVEMTASPYIHATTEDNFRPLVLDNSNAGPVVVNFWSRKAMPKVFAILGPEHALVAEYRPQLKRYIHWCRLVPRLEMHGRSMKL